RLLCSVECSSEGAEIQRILRGREAGGLDTLSFALIFIRVQGVFTSACLPRSHLLIYTQRLFSSEYTNQAQLFFHAYAHISAHPPSSLDDARITHAYEDPGRTGRDLAPPR